MALGMKMGGLSGGSSENLPNEIPSYTGKHTFFGDDKKGYIKMLSDGILTIPIARKFDIFVVDGGNAGHTGSSSGGVGGDGGNTRTYLARRFNTDTQIRITIGKGGTAWAGGIETNPTETIFPNLLNPDFSEEGHKGGINQYHHNGEDGIPLFNGQNGNHAEFDDVLVSAGGGQGARHASDTIGLGGKGGGGNGGKYDPKGPEPAEDGQPAQPNTGSGGGGGGGGSGQSGVGGAGGSGVAYIRWGY